MIGKDFNSLIDFVKAFPTEQSCIDHLTELRWNGYVVSPFDSTSKVYKCKGNKFRCKNTGKYFNVRTNTLFDNTKIELIKWFMAIWLVTGHKNGISSLQLSRDIDVTQKTAWFMLQRIRKCFGCENDHDLNNEVEIDETFVGGKNKNRHADKKVSHSTGRARIDKTPVLGMVERGGKVVARKVESTSVEHITPEVVRNVKDAMVYTDEWVGYKQVNKIYDHLYVKHNEGEYVNGRIYTNTIEGFWSILKRGIVGIYHFTPRKHIQRYVDEFVFRYNTRQHSEMERFNLLLHNTEHRLTYKELIYG
jgi:hypothetical protein